MPDGRTGLFAGLAKGIFGGLTERNISEQKKLAGEKQQAISLLSGLVDQVEPDSRPLLIKHIGDVMGLKGNQRGLWASLTGADVESDRVAVKNKLSEILGTMKGPGQKAALAPKPELQGTVSGGDTGIEGIALNLPKIGLSPDKRQGQMFFRDPYQEQLGKIETQYALRYQADQEKLYEKERLVRERGLEMEGERQKNRLAVISANEDVRAMRKVQEIAQRIALDKYGREGVTRNDMIEAAHELADKNGLDRDFLKARIGLVEANTAKAQAEAKLYTDPNTGEFLGKPPSQAERQRIDQTNQDRAIAAFKSYGDARAAANSYGQQHQQIFQQIQAIVSKDPNLVYDATNNVILDKATGKPAASVMRSKSIAPILAKARELLGLKEKSMEELRNRRGILQSFPDYFDLGNTEWDARPKANFGGVAPMGAPRTTGSTTSSGVTPGKLKQFQDWRIGETKNWESQAGRKPGEIITIGPNQYRVIQVLGDTGDGINQNYSVTRIR